MSTQKQPRGNIRDYIAAKKERYRHTFTFNGQDGTYYYTVYGERITTDHFNKLFPIELKSNVQHLDGRQIA